MTFLSKMGSDWILVTYFLFYFFNFRFAVDGFICVYDVSAVPNRLPERQTEFCSQILLNIAKTKKPMVVVATKCDEANEILVRELEKLINRKVSLI